MLLQLLKLRFLHSLIEGFNEFDLSEVFAKFGLPIGRYLSPKTVPHLYSFFPQYFYTGLQPSLIRL